MDLRQSCLYSVEKNQRYIVLQAMNSDFTNWFKASAAAKRYALIALVLCTGYYILEYINGRAQMADFRVYYDAAAALLNNTAMYGEAFGVSSGFYKYSPFAAFPFIPFALIPFGVASVIYYALLTFTFIWWPLRLIHYLQKNQVTLSPEKVGISIFLSVLFLADHIERELHLGNVNLFLLIAAFFVFLSLKKNKDVNAGILMGIILLFKPHFAILLPYLVWKKKWKSVLASVVSIAIGLALPAVVKGFSGNAELHAQWMETMQMHNHSLEHSPNTLYGIVNHFLLGDRGGQILVLALLSLVALLFILFLIRNKKLSGKNEIHFIEFFVLIAAIPNLTHTDTEHFMWTWPLISYAILVIVNEGYRNHIISIILLALAFIPYCVNSPDIVGEKIRFLFDEGGLLGVANLILIFVAIRIYMKQSKNKILTTAETH